MGGGEVEKWRNGERAKKMNIHCKNKKKKSKNKTKNKYIFLYLSNITQQAHLKKENKTKILKNRIFFFRTAET
jgi:hypothetical protein